jgi:hypothetical protein
LFFNDFLGKRYALRRLANLPISGEKTMGKRAKGKGERAKVKGGSKMFFCFADQAPGKKKSVSFSVLKLCLVTLCPFTFALCPLPIAVCRLPFFNYPLMNNSSNFIRPFSP